MFSTLLEVHRYQTFHAIQLFKAADLVFSLIHYLIQELKENICFPKT